MKTGTSYFKDMSAAISYYRVYGTTASAAREKVRKGEIHIGKPDLKPGQKLSMTDSGRRYVIED